jgi:hypothetical protein
VAPGGVACLQDLGTCQGAKKCGPGPGKGKGKDTTCPKGSVCQLNSCCDGQDICVPLCNPDVPCQQPV